MLKLIKYEMIHSYRSFAIIFGVFLLACVLVPFLPYDISIIGATLIMFAFFGISIAVFVTIIRNYNTSMFKKPGYLTLTLPVSTHELVISKVFSALIWLFITSVILFLGLIILVMAIMVVEGYQVNLFEIINEIFKNFDKIDFASLFALLFQLIVQSIVTILGFFALTTILQTKYTRNHKTALGFIIFVLYAFVTAIIGDMFSLNNGEFFISYGYSYNVQSISINWMSILYSCIEIAFFYIITIFVINKKIEIE